MVNVYFNILKRILRIMTILVIMLGLLPLPVLSSVGNVYAQDEVVPADTPEPPVQGQPLEETLGVEITAEPTLEESAPKPEMEEPALENQPIVETLHTEVTAEPTLTPCLELEEEVQTAGEKNEDHTAGDPGENLGEEAIAEIVTFAAENEIVLADERGEVLDMASQETAETLKEVVDPWYESGGQIIAYCLDEGSGCSCVTGANVCNPVNHLVNNPIQAAIDDAPSGTIIYIKPDSRFETMSVDVNTDVTLKGVRGNDTADISVADNVSIGTINLYVDISDWENVFASIVNVMNGSSAQIQDGIDIATNDGTVNVAPDTYNENVVVNKSITLNGDVGNPVISGAGGDAPTLESLTSNNGTGITIAANSITIQGFIIRNFHYGIENSGFTNININNNSFYITGSGAKAIKKTGSGSTIESFNTEDGTTDLGPLDVCPRIPLVQLVIPPGMVLNGDGFCVPEKNPNQDHKIVICHVPPGNPGNAHTITISLDAWNVGCMGANGQASHGPGCHGGDYLGACVGGGPECGDGVKEGDEACDDGNINDDDGCSSECLNEFCGDGVQQSNEACDDGNTIDGDGCSATCQEEFCGDGTVQAGLGEACDDGNAINNDGCSSTCQIERCGDGVQQSNEACDDGNNVNGDGCSATCTIEPYCGDGNLDAGEACDDGNNVSGDGCSATCAIETTTTTTTTVVTPLIPLIIPVTGQYDVITAGVGHTCALTAKDGLECWGLNDAGQVGDGTNVDKLAPVDVVGLEPYAIVDLKAGQHHTCALTSAGEVFCWGLNSSGQLGDGTIENRNVPVQVQGLEGTIVSISSGAEFSCAVNEIDEIFCWGNNATGQLNDGTEENRTTAVKATNLSDVLLVSGGLEELQGITLDGTVQLWNSQPIIPVTGLPNEDNLFVSADRFVSGGCLLTLDGEVNCWGGITNAAVQDVLLSNMLASGEGHACTMKTNGLVCWGTNSNGQLGDGSTDDSDSETIVQGLPQNIVALAAGQKHTCVILEDETVMCWGHNGYGQLGDGSVEDSNLPVATK